MTASRKALSLALGIDENKLVKTLADAKYNGKVEEEGTLKMTKPDPFEAPDPAPLPEGRRPVHYLRHRLLLLGRGGECLHPPDAVLDDHRVAARLVEGRHTHVMVKKAIAKGEKLPIAVAIGTHPAVTFASCTRVPAGMELPYAAELLGGKLKVKRCRNGIRVPDAEIVLEGYITAELTEEGPFVDITGTYDPVRMQHIIEFTGMYTKPDFIYHGILPGGDEHKILMGCPYEPKIYRAVAGVTEVRTLS